jgi:hypothetical protein
MSDSIHVIRLRGPWNFEFQPPRTLIEREDDLPAAGSVTMPTDLFEIVGTRFPCRLKLSRHFGCPTGLASGDAVYLVIEPAEKRGQVWMNDQRLGELAHDQTPTRFEISKWLLPRNRITIELDLPGRAVLDLNVRLEIRPSAGNEGYESKGL